MPRSLGDRYVCEKCKAMLVYEKPCACVQGHGGHSEMCCGQQMKAVSKEAAAAKK